MTAVSLKIGSPGPIPRCQGQVIAAVEAQGRTLWEDCLPDYVGLSSCSHFE